MSVEKAVEFMISKDLKSMDNELTKALNEKASEKLYEKRYEVAEKFFSK